MTTTPATTTQVPAPLVTETVYRCLECEAISQDVGGPLYECGNCGETFNRESSANNNHQCPGCNKFASKQAEESCSECEAGEVEEHQGFQCSCHDEWHLVD